jgi:hypothetical protein
MKDFNQQLINSLTKISASGTFFSAGVNDFCFPKMQINQLDEIAFPLNKIQIEALISIAHKAPFGKGKETIIDKNVRNCWEIDASEIKFEGSNWSNLLKNTLKIVQTDLGIEGKKIKANLYKMLIYEKGDFFLPHKDSEKEKGMFGTLAIGLPSKHTGGDLLISFEGETKDISFAENCANDKLPFVAFYADCEHEIKPLTSGFRVSLIYNLIDLQVENKIVLTSLQPEIDSVYQLLKDDSSETGAPHIYLLGHQYTPTNFSIEQLKLHDRPKAEVLLRAAENAGYYAKLALVTSYQLGSIDEGGYYDEDIDLETAEIGEIYDESLEIDYWDASPIPFIDGFNIEQSDLIYDFELNDGEPIEKDAEGYTGNAGMEMTYWYYYGAVVFWKKEHHLDLLNAASLSSKLSWLQYYTDHWNSISAVEKDMAKVIFEQYLPNSEVPYNIDETPFGAIINFILVTNDKEYFLNNSKHIFSKYFSNITSEHWIKLITNFADLGLSDLIHDNAILDSPKNTNHLLEVINNLDASLFSDFIKSALDKTADSISKFNFIELKSTFSKTIVVHLIELSIHKKNDPKWMTIIFDAITKRLDRTYVNVHLIEAILKNKLQKTELGMKILLLAKDHLTDRVINKPQVPGNWSRELPKTTSNRRVWNMLSDFIQSPTEQIFDFRSVQMNRSEMESAIRNVEIDLNMETIKKGSPHTLRLTKNTNSYQKKLKKWQEDCDLLKNLNHKIE